MAFPTLEDCKPSFAPVEYNVLIAPEETEQVTKGGIIKPPSFKEANDMASMQGLLVAVSPLAFNYDSWPEGSRIPQPGDYVIFAKYAGVLVEDSGREWRLCKDRDIIAVYSGAPNV